MRNATRLVYNALLSQIARLNGVAEVGKQFNVAPTIQQRLESKMQESSDFLGKINMTPVVEAQGAKLGLGVSGPVASRTNTDNADRQTRDVSTLDSKGYQCVQTNFDTHLKYQKLDAWAKFPDFQTRVAMAILRRQALDRIMIGFNGTSIAATTDLATNPLLQDVNKGCCSTCAKTPPRTCWTRAQPPEPSRSAQQQALTTRTSTRPCMTPSACWRPGTSTILIWWSSWAASCWRTSISPWSM